MIDFDQSTRENIKKTLSKLGTNSGLSIQNINN